MGAHSRRKGKVGELEWAAKLREEGYDSRRGRQYHGGPDSPDVVCEELAACHFEVKRTEALNLYTAIAQAQAEKREGQLAIVAHRRNNHRWIVAMPAEDFFRLLRGDLENNPAAEAAEGTR